ncbi:MAG: 7-cyano-7-deazaguanine synthase [Candidatus Magnetominusculus sp. LBB02]|nr:7-cyano-7-deazaguanine synthase [Candidatus Magnetominusculus sp. LBB02]MCG6552645.1 7-cyano-7-deazaguanine synthase [Candidatus Magnetominusculus sp. LBB02]
MKTIKAAALFSGGLDSTLAIITMLRQGVEVTAISFQNHFGCDITDKSSCSKDPYAAAEKFGFNVKLCHLADKFIEIVKHPKFGHGKNMNPCIDCRILMLKEAKVFMEMTGGDFIITGEVLGQRPMSQRRDCFPLIDKEADVVGMVVRPLSAKHLPPTRAELDGLIDRERLHAFNGRTRKPQLALAREFGLTDFPNPAGGCLLTDPIYSYRLNELLSHMPDPPVRDINLLKTGRHFRLSDTCKAIVGRDERENNAIESLAQSGDIVMIVEGIGPPTTIVAGAYDDKLLEKAAALTARYADCKHESAAAVSAYKIVDGGGSVPLAKLTAAPADNELLTILRIEEKTKRERKHARKTSSKPLRI